MAKKNNFNKYELFNVKIDVWIDDEEYEEVYKSIDLGKLKSQVDEFFKNKPPEKDFNKLLTKKSPIKSIKINGSEKKVINGWQTLFWAKYLRARIMENGTDDATELLDDLVIYLQGNIPYQSPAKEDKYLLQHLYLQELSACGKAGLESLGFALQAESILEKIEKNLDKNIFELYKLWAKLNQGIGYAHSKQGMEALKAYNEIIKNFSEGFKNSDSNWQSLIYDQAILSKAEVLEELQFSYHTIKTLTKLKEDRKREHRLIKEALAYQDMGRLEKAKCKIKELLKNPNSPSNPPNAIKEIFEQFKNWDVGKRKKSIWSKTLGLLFDYYLQEFTDQKPSKEDSKFLVEKVNEYKERLMVSKPERVSYYQQVARYLEWLATESYEYEDLYNQIRKELPEKENEKEKEPKNNKKINLKEFGKYEYDRFTDSMEKFFRKVNDLEKNNGKIQYREDEKKFLNALNEFEKDKYWLYKFKELERQQRTNKLDSKEGVSGKEQNESATDCPDDKLIPSCFACKQDSRSFCGILECAQEREDKDTFKLTEYFKTGSKPMEGNDYELIMRRENDRFLDYLKFRSRHPQLQSAENSYHFMGLQRWNSQTPTLTLSQGGGYFIYKQGKKGEVVLGIAIDPGFDFVDNLFHMGFTLNDIDFILISHAHLDHMRDFEPIISSLLDLKKREPKKKQKRIHVMMSLGVYHKLESVITNTTLREYLADTYIVDIEKEIKKEIKSDYTEKFRFKWDEDTKTYVSIITKDEDNDKDWELEIEPTKAYHDDYSEQSDSFGYILNFNDCTKGKPLFSFGYTGDTKWNKDILPQYKDCDVICIHLGALIESEKEDESKFSYYKGPQCEALIEKKGHLYLFGLLRFLKEIKENKNNKNRLILISEFGEELKGGIRIDLIHRLNQIFKDKSPICLPVDIGLNVMLAKIKNNSGKAEIEKDKKVWCFGCEDFIEAKDIGYRHFGYGRDEALFYFCKTCLKSKPENVIQERMRDVCEFGIPLKKAE